MDKSKLIIYVSDMHCRSCEVLIENKLKILEGVKNVKASTKSSTVSLVVTKSFDLALAEKEITDLGYSIVPTSTTVRKDSKYYTELITAGLVLASIYLFIKALKLDNITLGSINSESIFVVPLVGLLAGFSTCMALVGGLVVGLSSEYQKLHPSLNIKQKFRPHIFFNLGRIVSFALLGGVIAQLGTTFKPTASFNAVLTLTIGAVMLLLALSLLDLQINFRIFLPKSFFKVAEFGKNNEYSHGKASILGALTFFLPCGFTQAMQVLAISSGSFAAGATIMGLFAVGTTPGLLAIGGVVSSVRDGSFMRFFNKFVALLLISLAMLSFSNGLTLLGYKLKNISVKKSSLAVEQSGVQVIKMTQLASGYTPNSFVIKSGKRVRWIIDSKDIASCASSLAVPKLNIYRLLKKGENVIEFTPTEIGDISFSCTMGMYAGNIKVIE